MARRIKRYDNRKLYDTETSEYVSLSDIAALVRQGNTVEVVDKATGEDITARTLTQIILEEGRNGAPVIPPDLLHTLLRRSGEALDMGLDQIRSTVDGLVERSVGQLKRLVQSPRRRDLDALRRQLRHLEQRLSALLDDLDAPSASDSDAQRHPQEASGETPTAEPVQPPSRD
ncbi:polyhydroxyalkanoate synthesis regulator DNA-binding domain-containing protein [Salinibacter sp.]|jgi:polyhydroxyalkanoate synthesis repressor PhaR|uniref:polyhydroxyalkanoate synthesis regulator DNA-binding domain-containing protein n=1 Tax=Salinibacter sp. TaxID=2065818 RepID=UPI0021E7910F|nr:polyhydroxyalkanoate synthesis regulator DNA-binding domain-containing protein [Salinibacter sp.]